MSPMHVFTNGTDHYIAKDMEHLAQLVEKHTRMPLTDEDNLGDDGEWSQCADTASLKVNLADDSEEEDVQTQTMAEWAAKMGEGFFCSSEY